MTYQNAVLPEFWRLTNTQYVYSNLDAPQLDTIYATQAKRPDVTFTRLVGPVRNSAGSMVYLLKPSVPAPYAWVTPALVKANEQQTLPTVLNAKFDPATVAVFDTAADVTPAKLTAVPKPLDITTHVTGYAPGHVTMDLSAPAPAGAALVVSENYYPGWHATVDGKPVATIGRADYSLIGVALPAGATHIELSFDDAAYETGKKVTLAAIALTLLLTAGGVAADRRQRA
jgi:Bacterial membrane protein YfhO